MIKDEEIVKWQQLAEEETSGWVTIPMPRFRALVEEVAQRRRAQAEHNAQGRALARELFATIDQFHTPLSLAARSDLWADLSHLMGRLKALFYADVEETQEGAHEPRAK